MNGYAPVVSPAPQPTNSSTKNAHNKRRNEGRAGTQQIPSPPPLLSLRSNAIPPSNQDQRSPPKPQTLSPESLPSPPQTLSPGSRQRYPATTPRPPTPSPQSHQRSPATATPPKPPTLSPRRHQPCTTTDKRQTQERPQKTTKRWTIGSSGGGDNDVSDCKTTRQSTYISALVPPIRCCPAEAATTMAPIR